jgi:hypothetical protein
MNSFLRKTSVGFTFDTTRGNSTPVLIANAQQLSAISFRYNFINQRDPGRSNIRSFGTGSLVVQVSPLQSPKRSNCKHSRFRRIPLTQGPSQIPSSKSEPSKMG